MRLAISVVFSSVAGYFLGADSVDLLTVIMLASWRLLFGWSFKCL